MRPNSQFIAILTYHSLDDSGSVLSVSPRGFAEQMRILHELDVEVVPLTKIQEALEGASASRPLVAITFDDGFRNVYNHGFPALQRFGFPATVFLVTDYCGKTNAWPSQPTSIAPLPLLSWKEIREMSEEGISFGSHTRTHPELTTLPAHLVEEELLGSKRKMEDVIGGPVDSFAYPYGVYNDAVIKIAKSHFPIGCSTSLGFVGQQSDLIALERLDMYYLRRPMVFGSLFSRKTNLYIRSRRMIRDLRGHLAKTVQSPK